MAGTEVWVTHKGKRFKIVPESRSGSRLSGITPLDVINYEAGGLDGKSWQEEMERAWEKDWSDL